MYGKYPNNTGEQYKNELLESLDALIANAAAISPEGAEITIESLANNGSVNSVRKEFIDAANAEILKNAERKTSAQAFFSNLRE